MGIHYMNMFSRWGEDWVSSIGAADDTRITQIRRHGGGTTQRILQGNF